MPEDVFETPPPPPEHPHREPTLADVHRDVLATKDAVLELRRDVQGPPGRRGSGLLSRMDRAEAEIEDIRYWKRAIGARIIAAFIGSGGVVAAVVAAWTKWGER